MSIHTILLNRPDKGGCMLGLIARSVLIGLVCIIYDSKVQFLSRRATTTTTPDINMATAN